MMATSGRRTPVVVPWLTASTRSPSSRGADEPGQCRERVQAEHDRERAAVAAQEHAGLAGATSAAAGDGSALAHSVLLSAVTVRR